jgi:hypothetical protein
MPRGWRRTAAARRRGRRSLLGGIALAGCCLAGPLQRAHAQSPSSRQDAPLAAVEAAFQQARYWHDQLRLTESLGTDRTPSGLTRQEVQDSLQAYRSICRGLLEGSPAKGLPADERDALRVLAGSAGELMQSPAESAQRRRGKTALALLADSVLARYGVAANRVIVDGDTLNRLAVLARLSRTPDPARRRELFLALQPVWRSVNAGDEPDSPYRTMVRLRRAEWGDTASPIEAKGPAFGLSTPQLEEWLIRALDRWRAATPDSLLEPWDWYYFAGAASRHLSARVSRIADMQRVNDAYYAAIGASPARLHIRYDLAARPGKYPVAYTDFGSRNRWIGGQLVAGEPAVFTSYLDGNLDNLAELLHESGHAIHIAAIRTRPAYIDWPDNDTFTEALADLPALELYEPTWQWHFLGDSVPLAESLRAKYASIVMDMAWALLEIRVHRTPDADPNAIWADITSRYLHIRPHPEWSWWAMRGQLIDSPGYLVNYALGAFLVADMRARVATSWGPFTAADSSMYPRLAETIYRFGLERPSRRVLEEFLGRPARPEALLDDLARLSR